uniref:hypothetical protein n=1 Tax=Pseudoalteromonas sp. TaxID=53249 RepID=UPI003D0A9837
LKYINPKNEITREVNNIYFFTRFNPSPIFKKSYKDKTSTAYPNINTNYLELAPALLNKSTFQ